MFCFVTCTLSHFISVETWLIVQKLNHATNTENKIIFTHHCSDILFALTHWGPDKMASIFQMTFSKAFSWTKMPEFRLNFHWSLFLRVQLTYSDNIDSDNTLGLTRRWVIVWSNGGISFWCIYASLGLNELRHHRLCQSYNRGNIKAAHYWPFVRGIHQWLVVPLTKVQ